MMAEQFEFKMADQVRELGVRVIGALFGNLQNGTSDSRVEVLRSQVATRLAAELTPDFVKTDPTLAGFRQLHEKVGRSNRRYPSAPESLINLFLTRGTIPQINSVVDIYNLISLESRLAFGAHDASQISGNVELRLTDGSERFVPLGGREPEPVASGEYCYVDDSNEILCRLEHKQVEKTKVSSQTSSCFFIVQGNEATPPEMIEGAFGRLSELLSEYCSGTVVEIWNEAR